MTLMNYNLVDQKISTNKIRILFNDIRVKKFRVFVPIAIHVSYVGIAYAEMKFECYIEIITETLKAVNPDFQAQVDSVIHIIPETQIQSQASHLLFIPETQIDSEVEYLSNKTGNLSIKVEVPSSQPIKVEVPSSRPIKVEVPSLSSRPILIEPPYIKGLIIMMKYQQ